MWSMRKGRIFTYLKTSSSFWSMYSTFLTLMTSQNEPGLSWFISRLWWDHICKDCVNWWGENRFFKSLKLPIVDMSGLSHRTILTIWDLAKMKKDVFPPWSLFCDVVSITSPKLALKIPRSSSFPAIVFRPNHNHWMRTKLNMILSANFTFMLLSHAHCLPSSQVHTKAVKKVANSRDHDSVAKWLLSWALLLLILFSRVRVILNFCKS